ncbi:hypothetical protein QUA56_19420 [Microcoleus sp. N3A4]|uniref:hypothetical protein n=1 Tax=Cyanophyceae TaxID=3028117 RepID=UPI002FD2791D
MPSLLLSGIFSPHDWSATKIIEYFYSPLSRVIHFYPLNPTMCQFGVRNVGYMLANLNSDSDRPTYGLLMNGSSFLFVKLVKRETPQYALVVLDSQENWI